MNDTIKIMKKIFLFSLIILVIPIAYAGIVIETFTVNGTFTVPEDITSVEVLVVAGGGGGACRFGGGGGAGGLIHNNSYTTTPEEEINVVIGLGGIGGDVANRDGTACPNNNPRNFGGNGTDSIFGNIIAVGGGGGGGGDANDGLNGGSGGGGASRFASNGGTSISGQGYDGGDGIQAQGYNGAGGGGASEVGENGGSSPGDGGYGLNYSISGTNNYYAGGGGGGHPESGGSVGGIGGLGGGGNGSYIGDFNSSTPGINGTGGGGGAGGDQTSYGREGGTGIVIVRYFEDITSPTITALSINNTSPKYNDDVLVSALLQDETELDKWRIAHNQSGTMTNQSLNDISGVSLNATYTFTDAIVKHNVIAYQFWTNDSYSNINISNILTFSVENTPPEALNIVYPTADLRTNEQPLDLLVTYSADADNDAITIYYYINDSLNQTSANNVTFEAEDGYYTLDVSITDGEEFSSNVSVNFEIDTILPIMTVASPVEANYEGNIPIDVVCTDTNPFILNYTLLDADDNQIQSLENRTPIGNELSLADLIITEDLDNGIYTASFQCSDSHTKVAIDDYYINYEGNGIIYDTSAGIRVKIMQIGQPITPSTSKKIDRYEFNFGTTEFTETRTYKIISIWHDIYVIEDSEYDAHLVIWNQETKSGNWIDFESSDSQVELIKRINPRHLEIIISGTDFNFKSIGGLNIVTEDVEIILDKPDVVFALVIRIIGVLLGIVILFAILAAAYQAMKRKGGFDIK